MRRDSRIKSIIASGPRNMDLVQKGVAAYERDLCGNELKDGQFVAYQGDIRVALADTRPSLMEILKQKKIPAEELFVKCVSRDESEHDNPGFLDR